MVRFTRAHIRGFAVLFLATAGSQALSEEHVHHVQGSYETAAHDATPSPIPDRIVLTWQTDPATSQAVTWRTDTTVAHGIVEIAPADASPRFMLDAESLDAETATPFDTRPERPSASSTTRSSSPGARGSPTG
jgi:hypothetical protein